MGAALQRKRGATLHRRELQNLFNCAYLAQFFPIALGTDSRFNGAAITTRELSSNATEIRPERPAQKSHPLQVSRLQASLDVAANAALLPEVPSSLVRDRCAGTAGTQGRAAYRARAYRFGGVGGSR